MQLLLSQDSHFKVIAAFTILSFSWMLMRKALEIATGQVACVCSGSRGSAVSEGGPQFSGTYELIGAPLIWASLASGGWRITDSL